MGRLWDNKGGNRLRSKYLAKVARSVSTDSLTCLCMCFLFLSFTRKMNARAPGSLSQIDINGTKVKAYRIEMFTEQSVECEGIMRFAESSRRI